MCFTWAALAGDENTDALDHLSRRGGSLGEKDIGGAGAIEGCDRVGDDHGRESGLEMFCTAHEFVAVHLWHEEVAEQKIEGARQGLLDDLEGLTGRDCGNDTVAACFEEEGANREHLFVVVDTEDRLFRPQ